MKKILFLAILVEVLLIEALPASAAVTDNKAVWLSNYDEAASKRVNLSIIDGKANVTKRIYKDDAFFPTIVG